MRVRKGRRTQWNLSFASMSDIAFLLIIFFAVAGKFTRATEREVTLPAAQEAERMVPRDIELVVTADGIYTLNGSRIFQEALIEELESMITPDMTEEQRIVVIYADRDTEYKLIKPAIEAINKAGGNLEMAVRVAN